MVNSARCTQNLCEAHCVEYHSLWVAHIMANGEPSPATKFQQNRVTPSVALPLVVDKVPELGKLEELEETADEFLPFDDTSRVAGGKSNFPVRYVT